MKTCEYTGYSDDSLQAAILNALQKASEHSHFEVIEARSSQFRNENRKHYQVTLTTYHHVMSHLALAIP